MTSNNEPEELSRLQAALDAYNVYDDVFEEIMQTLQNEDGFTAEVQRNALAAYDRLEAIYVEIEAAIAVSDISPFCAIHPRIDCHDTWTHVN